MVALTSARTAMQNNMLMNQQIQMQNDQMQQQQQDQIQQQQNQIQQQQMDENQQRYQQRQELEDQRQMQEQMILDQQQDRLDNILSAQNSLMNNQNQANMQLVNIPSSRRVVQVIQPSNYNFGYSVSDYTTGDIKSQQEIRRGDNVQGQYTMIDTDGYRRTVDYTTDDNNGFVAGVRREQIRPQYIYIDSPIQASQYLRQRSLTLVPASYSTAHVSKNENGVHNEYTTSTSSNY